MDECDACDYMRMLVMWILMWMGVDVDLCLGRLMCGRMYMFSCVCVRLDACASMYVYLCVWLDGSSADVDVFESSCMRGCVRMHVYDCACVDVYVDADVCQVHVCICECMCGFTCMCLYVSVDGYVWKGSFVYVDVFVCMCLGVWLRASASVRMQICVNAYDSARGCIRLTND